jgi:FeS assembly protein IscX
MALKDEEISRIASLVLAESQHLFPSPYPDIPLNISMLKDALTKTGHEVTEAEMNELMISVELKLAAIAPVNWNNFGTIAILLNNRFPDEDLVAISPERIIEMVKELPNFDNTTPPDEYTLDSVIYTWISLNDDDPGFSEDDAWV